MRNLLIFDCFGVLMSEIAPKWFRQKFGDDCNALKNKYFADGDVGKKDIYCILSEIECDLKIPASEIISDWTELAVINEGVLPLIEKLRSDNAVSLLSNAPRGVFDMLGLNQKFGEYFDNIFISGELGMVKPDPKIYRYVISSYSEKFKKIYMIDDNPSNFCGVKDLGIVPILFRGNNDLQDRLCELLIMQRRECYD